MSWQLVSFVILAGVILAGFAWYERSRPPSQVVALVAALAALAIAGRIAFAAFPNVKPTTDIVIFAGYALGGAPGFAVGALTALVSNFWFGQGPWTPWQMAGWGLCGLLGAALGLGWRDVGRLGLATVCGLAAVLYGALLNFSLMATYGGHLSWQTFVLYEGRAVPFEIAHVAGNVAFALVAGPAMLRMLTRFRERFEWRRGGEDPGAAGEGRPPARRAPSLGGGIAALLLVILAAALAPAPARGAPAGGEIGGAVGWLKQTQNDDGGFGSSPGKSSGAETTCWAALGLEAAGVNPLDVRKGGKTPIDFLRSGVAKLKRPGDIARTILVLEGAGIDPHDFGGHNLVSRLRKKQRDDGSYERWPATTAFAVMALRGAGASGLKKTLKWLNSVQNDDGGWGDVPGSPSTADGTGAALQALSKGSKGSKRGLDYLRTVQRKGGGFPLGGNGEVNAQSTAWAIQGIIHAGADPEEFRRGGASAPDYLSARQAKDGHYRYSKASDQTPTWVTGNALAAAAGKYYPVPTVPRLKTPAPSASQPSPTTAPQPNSSPTTPVSPSTTPAPVPLPGFESSSSSSGSGAQPPSSASGGGSSGSGSSGGGGGSSAGHSAPGGEIPLGESPSESPGGASEEAPTAPVPTEASASEPDPGSDSGTSTSTYDSIVVGLLAGGLLFGAGYGARKGWMRWRYGL